MALQETFVISIIMLLLTCSELPYLGSFYFLSEFLEEKRENIVAEDKQKKRRVIKKSETVREKRAKAAGAKPKQRRVKQAARKANGPIKAVGRTVTRILRPLSFLLWPFRTKPMRFVGRILYKVLGIGYFVNSWKELRQVEWPSRSETAKLTLAVFVFAFAIAGFIAILDYGLDKVFKQLLT